MAMSLEKLLDLPCSRIAADGAENSNKGSGTEATLGALRASQPVVYDFWTTRCTNCPAALDSLNAIALERPSVRFVGVNIDNAVVAKELIKKAASEGRWSRLTHASLSETVKEQAKDLLGMQTVPFYVVVSQDGGVICHGNAKMVKLKSAETLDAVLTGKRDQKEHNPAVANAPPPNPVPLGKAPGPSMDCDGGVCKLTRKKKPPAKSEAAPISHAPAAATTATIDTTDASPANNSTDCIGGVCKLVRKKKPAEPTTTGEDGTNTVAADAASHPSTPSAAAAAAAAPANAVADAVADAAADPAAPGITGTTSASGRMMECEGGVCKLVRKTKSPDAPKDKHLSAKPILPAAAEVAPCGRTNGGEHQSPIVVGDLLPSLRVVQLGSGQVEMLDKLTAGKGAVLDFWTTRCVRCPAALDALEALAQNKTATSYVSVNLDDLEAANKIVSEGRWPSVAHVFAGRDEESEALEVFKARTAMKSVPFYVVLDADGRVLQIGGPKSIKLGITEKESKVTSIPVPTSDTLEAPSVLAVPAATTAAASDSSARSKAHAFTMDEDF